MPNQLWLFPLPPSPASSHEALEATLLAEQRGVSFFDLPCRSILNRCVSDRMPFEWTLNPYRGCEFGCAYCYARYSHEFLGMENWLDFQNRIFVKRRAAALLPRELTRNRLDGKSIAIGTVTDPYQPAERQYRVTRGILEVLARFRDLHVSLTTKSALITRDLDLLQGIASRSRLTINVSLITLNRRMARILEPRAPTPERRLATIRTLASAGLRVGVFAMPVLPGLTDSRRGLEALVRRAAESGAAHLAAQVLFLRGSTRAGFLARLEKDYPALVGQYRRLYGSSAYAPRGVRDRVKSLVEELKKKYDLSPGSGRREVSARRE